MSCTSVIFLAEDLRSGLTRSYQLLTLSPATSLMAAYWPHSKPRKQPLHPLVTKVNFTDIVGSRGSVQAIADALQIQLLNRET